MKFRIVKDKYAGYEVQEKRWWWPFWTQSGRTNTHYSLESAEEWAKDYYKGNCRGVKVLKEWEVK